MTKPPVPNTPPTSARAAPADDAAPSLATVSPAVEAARQAKAERLAEALRANLRRRKAQARARDAGEPPQND